MAGCNITVHLGRRRNARRSASRDLQNASDTRPPTTPRTGVANQLCRMLERVGRHTKQRLVPRIERCTTTAATDATTVDPSSVAFMLPMISSSANNTAAIGVLNAAASAPAAPTGMSSLMRAGDRRSQRPMADAMPAPNLHRGALSPHGVARADAQHGRDELAERDPDPESHRPADGRRPWSAAPRSRAHLKTRWRAAHPSQD